LKAVTYMIDKILQWVLIAMMAVLVLDVSWQVFTRFIIKNPSSFTEELASFLLIWIGLLGASYAYRTKVHLGIDLLPSKLKGSSKEVLEIVINVIVMIFAAIVMVAGGIKLVNLTLELNQISASMGIRMGYIYLVLPLSGLLIVYYSSLFIASSFNRLFPSQSSDQTLASSSQRGDK